MTARAGQWIDSPSGRIARAKEIEASWQQLWRDEYSAHVPDALRLQFDEDYQTWQTIKEQLAAMGVVSLMAPATGELLDRWAVRARDWYERFLEQGVKTTAPAPPKPKVDDSRSTWDAPTRFAWAVAGILGSAALFAGVSYFASRSTLKRATT